MVIRAVSPDWLFDRPEYPELERLYMEMAYDALRPRAEVMKDRYIELYDRGVLDVLAAQKDDGTVVGFAGVIYSPSLHTGKLCANVEAIFVHPDARRTGAGLRLLSRIRKFAFDRGCPAVFYSAQPGSGFDKVLMQRSDMRLAQNIYMEPTGL